MLPCVVESFLTLEVSKYSLNSFDHVINLVGMRIRSFLGVVVVLRFCDAVINPGSSCLIFSIIKLTLIHFFFCFRLILQSVMQQSPKGQSFFIPFLLKIIISLLMRNKV